MKMVTKTDMDYGWLIVFVYSLVLIIFLSMAEIVQQNAYMHDHFIFWKGNICIYKQHKAMLEFLYSEQNTKKWPSFTNLRC